MPPASTISNVVPEHLQALYGPEVTNHLLPRVQNLYSQFAERGSARPQRAGLRLTERDAILISYADQVQEPGQPPLRILANFAQEHLKELVSGIHLLPFYPWSSDDGFSVKNYMAVEPRYGTWDDIAAFSNNFDLMVDGVFNHLSAQSEWFQGFLRGDPRFIDYFITVEGNPDLSQVIRPRTLPLLTQFPSASGPKKVWTTFSADQVDLNFRNPEVLLAILGVLLFYVSQGARFIRLDAIAFLWKEMGTSCLHRPEAHRVVQLLRAVLDDLAPDVLLVTETNVPHAENLSYFGDGCNEAQLVYNFALPPLVLHSLQTGNAEKLTGWARTLALPSKHVTFFNFLASHDGIGLNPVRGILNDAEIDALVSYTIAHAGFLSFKTLPNGGESPYELNINFLDALSKPAAGEAVEMAVRKFLCAQAIMLSLQGVPGIYFHSLFGSRGDRSAVESSGHKRRINREKLQRARLEAELRDAKSLRCQVFTGYASLLRVRREHPAFSPNSPQIVPRLEPRLFGVLRSTPEGGDRMLCLHNVSGETVPLDKISGAELSEEERTLCSAKGELAPFEVCWLPSGAEGK